MADEVDPWQITLHEVNKAIDEGLELVFSGDRVALVGWKTNESESSIDVLFLLMFDVFSLDYVWLRQLEVNQKDLMF